MKYQPGHFHQILTDGGMGDIICEMVAVDFNLRNNPEIYFHVWVPDYLFEFAKHVLNTPANAFIRPFSRAESKFRQDIRGYTTEWRSDHTCMRTHPVDYGFHMLSDRHIYDLNKKNYLQMDPSKIDISNFNLPERYVCIVGTAAEPVKAMPSDTIDEISEFVLQKGFTPVFIGKEKSETGYQGLSTSARVIDFSSKGGMNLINKTTALTAAAVISGARCIVGMDSGLIHLAGFTDTEIVAGYTLVDPVHVAPIRKGSQSYKFQAVEPDESVPNRYYQTNLSMFKPGDSRQFPGWEESIASMTGVKFIERLSKIL